MTEKEIVKRSIQLIETERTPFYLMLRSEVEEELKKEMDVGNVNEAIGGSLEVINVGFSEALLKEVAPGEFEDHFGVRFRRTGPNSGVSPVDPPIKKANQLNDIEFPDPTDDRLFSPLESRELADDRFSLAVKYAGLFERAYFLRGMDNLYMDFYRNPEFVEELLDRILGYLLSIVNRMLEYDVDGVMIGEDWGGQDKLLFNPKTWRKFIKPRVEKLYAKIKASGLPVFLHSCGNIESIIPDLIEIGVNVINPLQVLAMNPFEIKEKYGDKVAFFGGVSTQILPFSTPAEVKDMVKKTLEKMSRGGGYILAPDQEIQRDVPLENIFAFIEAAKEYR